MVILKDDIYNASIEKYYDYEHKMFTDMMVQEVRLYQKWNCDEICFGKVLKERSNK